MITKKRKRELFRQKPRNHEERLFDWLLRLMERWDNSNPQNLYKEAKELQNSSLGRIVLSDSEWHEIHRLLGDI